MRTLVLNLTRFGDLLQSQPALAELAAQGHDTALACLENFAAAASLLPQARQVFPLPGSAFLKGLTQDWRAALGDLTAFAHGVERDFGPQQAVNLTPAVSARLLARRLCGDVVLGFGLDPLGFRQESTPWAAFLEASSANRGLSPFNVVDLFRKAAGVGQGPGRFALRRPDAAASAQALDSLRAEAPQEAAFFVGFQLGASAAARQWPVASFARVGQRLWECCRAVPVLLGGPGETALASAYRQQCPAPAVDMIGRTNLPQLAAVLAHLRLLVTNDTGTMHLAAGLDVPCAALFLATAQPFDTGPYRPGCLSLEPDMACHPCAFGTACPHDNACLHAIGPDTVLGAAMDFFAAGQFARRAYPGARAWLSAFDASGFMDQQSLSGHDREPRAVWLRLERHVFRQFLDEKEPSLPDEPLPELPQAARTDLVRTLDQSASLLHLLEGQAGLLSRGPAMKDKFLATWGRLHRLWLASPALLALGHLWLAQSQEPTRDLGLLLARIRRYAGCVAAFRALVDRT